MCGRGLQVYRHLRTRFAEWSRLLTVMCLRRCAAWRRNYLLRKQRVLSNDTRWILLKKNILHWDCEIFMMISIRIWHGFYRTNASIRQRLQCLEMKTIWCSRTQRSLAVRFSGSWRTAICTCLSATAPLRRSRDWNGWKNLIIPKKRCGRRCSTLLFTEITVTAAALL